jgi:FdhD protein
MSKGIQPVTYISVDGQAPQQYQGEIVDERQVCISVNGSELATMMCSPNDLDMLALGFLHNEGLIGSLDDVRHLSLSKNDSCVDVWLQNTELELPRRLILTSGCGGGVTFDDMSQQHEPLRSDLRATPPQLADLMKQLHLGADLYQQARGIHTAALAENDSLLLQVEDVGRHNCLDKLRGASLLANIPTKDRILLTSGRISSEMINKARRLETPIVCSRTSPTNLSVALAEAWHITVVGYLRQSRMRIYSHAGRLLDERQAGALPGDYDGAAAGQVATSDVESL